jgi:hypothetical protein
MSINRFSARMLIVLPGAIALFTTLSAYQVQRHNAGSAISADTYRPLPPGKQTTLINGVRQACLDQVHGELMMGLDSKHTTYTPLPPGKEAALFNAAIRNCIDEQLVGAGQRNRPIHMELGR